MLDMVFSISSDSEKVGSLGYQITETLCKKHVFTTNLDQMITWPHHKKRQWDWITWHAFNSMGTIYFAPESSAPHPYHVMTQSVLLMTFTNCLIISIVIGRFTRFFREIIYRSWASSLCMNQTSSIYWIVSMRLCKLERCDQKWTINALSDPRIVAYMGSMDLRAISLNFGVTTIRSSYTISAILYFVVAIEYG